MNFFQNILLNPSILLPQVSEIHSFCCFADFTPKVRQFTPKFTSYLAKLCQIVVLILVLLFAASMPCHKFRKLNENSAFMYLLLSTLWSSENFPSICCSNLRQNSEIVDTNNFCRQESKKSVKSLCPHLRKFEIFVKSPPMGRWPLP